MEDKRLDGIVGELEWQIWGMDRIAPEVANSVNTLYKRVEAMKQIVESYEKAELIGY